MSLFSIPFLSSSNPKPPISAMLAMSHAVFAMLPEDIIPLCDGHYLRIIEIAENPAFQAGASEKGLAVVCSLGSCHFTLKL
jgi:hypothetical protein